MITARELIEKIDELALVHGDFVRDLPVKWGTHSSAPAIVIEGHEVSLKVAPPPGSWDGPRARRDPFGTSNVA